MGFYRVSTGFHKVFHGPHWYWVLLGFTGFHEVFLEIVGFRRVILGFRWVSPGFTRFY